MDNARATLLNASDVEFNHYIKTMDIQTLVGTIGLLQKEMEAEQVHFDDVSARLGEASDKEGPEKEALSAELMAVQANLAKLMARNMRCFNEQAANENQALLSDISGETSRLDRSSSGQISSRSSDVNSRSSFTNGSTSEVRSRSHLKNGEGLYLPVSHRARKTSPRRTGHKTSRRRQVYDEGEPDVAGYEESLTSDEQNENVPSHAPRRDIVSPESQHLIDFGQVSGDSSSDTHQITAEKNQRNEKTQNQATRAEFERNVLKDFEKLMRFEGDEPLTSDGGDGGSVYTLDGVTQSESYTEIDVDRIGEEDEGQEEDPSEWKQAGDDDNTAIPEGPIIYKTSDNPYKSSESSFKIAEKLFKPDESIYKSHGLYPDSSKRRRSSSDNTTSSEGTGYYDSLVHTSRISMVRGSHTQPENISAGDDTKSTDCETSPDPTVQSSVSESFPPHSSSIASETVPSLSSDSETDTKPPHQGTAFSTMVTPQGVTKESAGDQATITAMNNKYRDLFSGPLTSPGDDGESGDRTVDHVSSTPPPTSPTFTNTQSVTSSNKDDNVTNETRELSRSAVQLVLSSPHHVQVTADDNDNSDVTSSSQATVTRVSLRQTSTLEPTPTSKVHFRSYVSLVADDIADTALLDEQISKDEVLSGTNIESDETEDNLSEPEKKIIGVDEEKSGMGNLQDVGGQDKDEDSVSVKSAVTPACQPSEGFTADDKVKDKITLKDWDPTPLLQDLYKIQLAPDEEEDFFEQITMEGYMEKLPINKKKATLLKTWKRRYFKTESGHLHYFEPPDTVRAKTEDGKDVDKPSGSIQLIGGSIESLDNRIVGIDDGRGRYLVVRAPTDSEYEKWVRSLKSQTVENIRATWVKPIVHAIPSRQRNVVIIDIGSCSVRAGLLGDEPSLPSLFFPCIMATDNETRDRVFGFEALLPDKRATHTLSYPVRPSVKVDKFAVDMTAMPDLFEKVFNELEVDPSTQWVVFSAPGNFSDKIKSHFMDILIHRFQVVGVNIVAQTLLSLYSYNSRSGIVVDVGERLEIVPVTDGYIVEAGVTRQPYGGHRITEALNSSFTESKYRFFTDVEFQIVRLAMENSCYVAEVYNEEVRRSHENPKAYKKTIHLEKYELPQGTWKNVTHSQSRFSSPEGLFNTELWGMDNPQIHKLVAKAVQVCPMDLRREMWRSIFLSGGVTLLPGFSERLQLELTKLAPPSIKVQVHASPQRYHSAYIGACALANLKEFEQACIKAEEWREYGPPCLRKWHMY